MELKFLPIADAGLLSGNECPTGNGAITREGYVWKEFPLEIMAGIARQEHSIVLDFLNA